MAIAYSSRRNQGRTPAASARKLGTWKLAYADFLTALCAFFLIMWIIHGISKDERENIAQKFGASIADTNSNPAPDKPAPVSVELVDVLKSNADLNAFGSSVTIVSEGDFVRIELSDVALRPLFDTGDGALNQTGIELTRVVGHAISLLNMPVMIEGHTDSHPSRTEGYSNWELSSDRANSARRILIESGVDPSRIHSVTGLAHTRPILPDQPESAANRRISIVLVISPDTA